MKIYAKCPEGVKVDYLTAGRLYEVVEETPYWFEIVDDVGCEITCGWESSAHIGDGLNWTRIEVKTRADVLADEAENMVEALRKVARMNDFDGWAFADDVRSILARIDEVKE